MAVGSLGLWKILVDDIEYGELETNYDVNPIIFLCSS